MTARGKSKVTGAAAKHTEGFLPALLIAGAIACGFGMLLLLRLANAPVFDARVAWEMLPLGTLLAALMFLVVLRRAAGDPSSLRLMLPVILLAGLGMVAQVRMGASLAPEVATRSLLAYPIGVMVMLVVSFVAAHGRYKQLAVLSWLWWLLAVGVIGALLALGTRFRGAVFAAGGLTPTEVIKPLLVLFLAARLAPVSKRKKRAAGGALPAGFGITLVALSVPLALLVLQRDLGMVAMIAATFVLMLYAADGRMRWLVLGGTAAVLMGVGMALLASHGQQRLAAWANPFADPTGLGWQPLRSLSALYTGGLWGTGIGQGTPSMIPVAESDFIYAVLSEELGFIGAFLLVATFVVTFREGLSRASECSEPFGRLAATGLLSLLAIQALLNLGGVTKALPLTGVPLPFVSHGGSSLEVSFAMIGLIVAVGTPAARKSSRSRGRRK